MTRQDVTDADMAAMVETEVLRKIGAAESFTAYDITTALRTDNPGLNILHSAVKPHVHPVAGRAVQANTYSKGRMTGGAFFYQPLNPHLSTSDDDLPDDGRVDDPTDPDVNTVVAPAPLAPTNVHPAGAGAPLNIPS